MNEHIKQDCKYCIDNTDAKVKLPFWCERQKHYVSKKTVTNAICACT